MQQNQHRLLRSVHLGMLVMIVWKPSTRRFDVLHYHDVELPNFWQDDVLQYEIPTMDMVDE
jgi:hypothetical protein